MGGRLDSPGRTARHGGAGHAARELRVCRGQLTIQIAPQNVLSKLPSVPGLQVAVVAPHVRGSPLPLLTPRAPAASTAAFARQHEEDLACLQELLANDGPPMWEANATVGRSGLDSTRFVLAACVCRRTCLSQASNCINMEGGAFLYLFSRLFSRKRFAMYKATPRRVPRCAAAASWAGWKTAVSHREGMGAGDVLAKNANRSSPGSKEECAAHNACWMPTANKPGMSPFRRLPTAVRSEQRPMHHKMNTRCRQRRKGGPGCPAWLEQRHHAPQA